MQELKEELKALGLDVKGVKADLVKRLEAALGTKPAAASVKDVSATKSVAPAGGAQVGRLRPLAAPELLEVPEGCTLWPAYSLIISL